MPTSKHEFSTLRRHPLFLSDLTEMRLRDDVTLQSMHYDGDTRIIEYSSHYGNYWIAAEILNPLTGRCLMVLVPESRASFVFATKMIMQAVGRRVFRRYLANMRQRHLWKSQLQERVGCAA